MPAYNIATCVRLQPHVNSNAIFSSFQINTSLNVSILGRFARPNEQLNQIFGCVDFISTLISIWWCGILCGSKIAESVNINSIHFL